MIHFFDSVRIGNDLYKSVPTESQFIVDEVWRSKQCCAISGYDISYGVVSDA